MDARPEIPDPQHDEHVAFPEATEPPPESWWGPAPPPPPALPPASGIAGRRRRSAGWWAVVAVFLFAGAMSGHTGDLFAHGGIGSGAGGEVAASSSIELVEEPVAPSGELEPTDVPLYAIPLGTLWFRLELVGNDPRATVEVTTDHGPVLDTGEVALPYAGRLTRDNPDDALTITVHGAYRQRQVQCRVYVGDALVAIGTGDDTATCEVPATR